MSNFFEVSKRLILAKNWFYQLCRVGSKYQRATLKNSKQISFRSLDSYSFFKLSGHISFCYPITFIANNIWPVRLSRYADFNFRHKPNTGTLITETINYLTRQTIQHGIYVLEYSFHQNIHWFWFDLKTITGERIFSLRHFPFFFFKRMSKTAKGYQCIISLHFETTPTIESRWLITERYVTTMFT